MSSAKVRLITLAVLQLLNDSILGVFEYDFGALESRDSQLADMVRNLLCVSQLSVSIFN
jgi:hypothetical protein